MQILIHKDNSLQLSLHTSGGISQMEIYDYLIIGLISSIVSIAAIMQILIHKRSAL